MPPLTKEKRFIDKMFRNDLLEGAILQGLQARGKGMGSVDDARDIGALYTTCDPRDGAESALARLIPMLLHATTSCLERAENLESPEPATLNSPMRSKARVSWRSLQIRSTRIVRSASENKMSREGRKHKRNTGPMLASPRCGARIRSGVPCRSPAVAGKKRCRMHGGAKGSGAPQGNKNALKHGAYTREALERRAQIRGLVREARELLKGLR